MAMVKVKARELLGAALDWAVAKCEWNHEEGNWDGVLLAAYSTEWEHGGPIVEREGIATRKHSVSGAWYAMALDDAGDGQTMMWDEFTVRGGERTGPYSYHVKKRQQRFNGDTLLTATMRCYVASKMGAEVEVPAELVK